MRFEFYAPTPGVFSGCIFYREVGSEEWIPLEELSDNNQRIIFELFKDNGYTKKLISSLRKKEVLSIWENLKIIIPKVWGKLTPEPDIDGTKLNFEIPDQKKLSI